MKLRTLTGDTVKPVPKEKKTTQGQSRLSKPKKGKKKKRGQGY
tara:strand:- start:1313 stop:1441 length:129 start_codon:yes stop_codon:yes gene_type:complete